MGSEDMAVNPKFTLIFHLNPICRKFVRQSIRFDFLVPRALKTASRADWSFAHFFFCCGGQHRLCTGELLRARRHVAITLNCLIWAPWDVLAIRMPDARASP